MFGLLPFASIFLLACEASGSEEGPDQSPALQEPLPVEIRIPTTKTPSTETLDELARNHREAHGEFERECRRFITRAALDGSLTPEARMKAIEQH